MLAVVEVGKKQDYIFRSNRLREIIGASMIIRYVSEELPKEWINSEDQVILEGGGHSIYSFEQETECRRFISELSKEVLRRFPGLELNVATATFDPEKDQLPKAIDCLFHRLNKKKANGMPLRQLSFGIEERCQSTYLPANQKFRHHDELRVVSSEIWAKWEFQDDIKAEDYFRDLIIPGVSDRLAKMMSELEDRRGKTAVIHIDGNRMGVKLQAFNDHCVPEADESLMAFNQRYKKEFQQFSRGIDKRYKAAFRKMMEELTRQVKSVPSEQMKRYEEGVTYRPIIFAGDDISFILPGELGVEAARIMLEKLEQDPIVIGGKKHVMHACAGIAIVRSGFPFARAHDLAEQLCASAKTRIMSDQEAGKLIGRDGNEADASALDFHILYGDWSGSLHQWRSRQYQGNDRSSIYQLTMKPIYLKGWRVKDGNCYGWDDFQEAYHRLSTGIADGKIARSKVKGLRSVLKRGPVESKRFVTEHGLGQVLGTLSNVPLAEDEMFTETDRVCPYYDAIEAMDSLHVIGKGGK